MIKILILFDPKFDVLPKSGHGCIYLCIFKLYTSIMFIFKKKYCPIYFEEQKKKKSTVPI